MLTEKDFNTVAKIIKNSTKIIDWQTRTGLMQAWYLERVEITKHLADYFATQNPHFDRDRFMKACGLGSNENQCNRCEVCTNTSKNNKCPLFEDK